MEKSAPIRHSGNENLFLAVEMSLLSTLSGTPLHIHAEGLRGTGKTTVMRWAQRAMPSIARIAGCRYYCDPSNPRCPDHKDGSGFTSEDVRMPFVEVGHGAKLGTILGSIDLTRLTSSTDPKAALLPGSIPMANRGVIFVDEVNRLAETAPEITDVLLSVMGTKPGLVTIEEVGLPPCELEVASSVWAASNPDEDPGPLEDIRKQLADRFDLVVSVQRPSDPTVVERLLFSGESIGDQVMPFSGLAEKAILLAGVSVPPYIVRYISQLYVHRNVESLRAAMALELSGRLLSAIRGRDEVTYDELLTVLPLVLRHRVEPAVLSEILRDLELRKAAGAVVKPVGPQNPPSKDTDRQDPPEAGTGQGAERSKKESEPDLQPVQSPLPSPTSSPNQKPARTSWFERLADRYRRASTCNRPVSQGRAGVGGGVQRLPDPASLKAVSPPEKAKRITSLAWPDLVTPPDWRDRV